MFTPEIQQQLEKVSFELQVAFGQLTSGVDFVQVKDWHDAEDEDFQINLPSQYAYRASEVCARMGIRNISLQIRTHCDPDEIYDCYPVDSNRTVLYVTAKAVYQLMKKSKSYSGLFKELDKLTHLILNENLKRLDGVPMDTIKLRKKLAMDRFYSADKVSKILK